MNPQFAFFVTLLSIAVAIPAGSRFELERSKDGFGVRAHGFVETIAPGRFKIYPLPQSTAAEYIRLRPADARRNPFKLKDYERQEVIGPTQREGGLIWFGNQYYDGEGMRGVGAFGFFDTATRRYALFSPPEVAPYEVSALLVKPDFVWLALDSFGEDVSTAPGGLVQWNRATHVIRRYPVDFDVTRIRAEGSSLRLETRDGYALLHGNQIRRFLKDGREVASFPARPSQY